MNVLEGSYSLNSALRPFQDVTIAINGGVHLDLIKRIVRDIVEAKVTSKDTLFQGMLLFFSSLFLSLFLLIFTHVYLNSD